MRQGRQTPEARENGRAKIGPGPGRAESGARAKVDRSRARRVARAVMVAGLTVSVALVLLSASGERGLRRVQQFSVEVARIEALNADLAAENTRLEREIEALRDDPAAAEAVARDELGFIRPGEKVFRFEGQGR